MGPLGAIALSADGAHVSAASAGVPDWIPIGALVAAAVALLGLAANRLSERRDRRRTLYSDAYRAAVGWGEMYYRVRRRDPEGTYKLATRFHEIQEEIDFHQNWITSESVPLGRAYCRLVLTIKARTQAPIREAWSSPPAELDDGFSVAPLAAAGEIEAAKDRFIADLRDHLSLWPHRRFALYRRYREKTWAEIKADIGRANENKQRRRDATE